MPQASSELQAKMQEYFPGLPVSNIIGDDTVLGYLETKGIKDLDRNGNLVIPLGAIVTDKEINCLNYLFAEWDYTYEWEGVVQ